MIISFRRSYFRINVLHVVPLLALLSACGGGESNTQSLDSDPIDTNSPPTLVGYFRDAAYENLSYQSCDISRMSCYSGRTDSQGAFRYNQGDMVQFSVSSVPLSLPVNAHSLLTPYSITKSNAEAEQVTRALLAFNVNPPGSSGLRMPDSIHQAANEVSDKTPISSRSAQSLEVLASQLKVPLPTVLQAVEHLKSTSYLEQLNTLEHPHAKALLGTYTYRDGYYNTEKLRNSPAARIKLKIWQESTLSLLNATSYNQLISTVEKRNDILLASIDGLSSILSLAAFTENIPSESELIGIELLKTNAEGFVVVLKVVDNVTKSVKQFVHNERSSEPVVKGMLAVFQAMSLDLGGVIADSKDALGVSLGDYGDPLLEVATPVLSELSAQLYAQHKAGNGLSKYAKANPSALWVDGFFNAAKIVVALDGARTAALARWGSEARLTAFEYLDAYYRGAGSDKWMEGQGIKGTPSMAIQNISIKYSNAEYKSVADVFTKAFNIAPGLFTSIKAQALVKIYQVHVNRVYQSTISDMGGLPGEDGRVAFNQAGPVFLCNNASTTASVTFSVGATNVIPASWRWVVPEGVKATLNQNTAQLTFSKPGIYFVGLHASQFDFGLPSHATKAYYVRQCITPSSTGPDEGYRVKSQTTSAITYEIPSAMRDLFRGWMTEKGQVLSSAPEFTVHYNEWDAIVPVEPIYSDGLSTRSSEAIGTPIPGFVSGGVAAPGGSTGTSTTSGGFQL